MQILNLSDKILLPIAPSILGTISDYLESLVVELGDRLFADDGKGAERSQNLLGQKSFDSDSQGVAAMPSFICAESTKITHTIQYQYCSTFAHRLAAKFNVTPIEICQQLHPLGSQHQSDLSIECWYNTAGYTYFEVPPGEISRWLEYISNLPLTDRSTDRNLHLIPPRSDLNLAIYARARCHSVLELARTQQIVTIADCWQIEPAKHPQDRHERGSLITFEESSERHLIRSLMTVLDAIYSHSRFAQIAAKSPNWQKLTLDLAGCWLDFDRDCRIFGDLHRQNPHLAIARCRLTAIVRRYLQLLLEDYLGVEAEIQL